MTVIETPMNFVNLIEVEEHQDNSKLLLTRSIQSNEFSAVQDSGASICHVRAHL